MSEGRKITVVDVVVLVGALAIAGVIALPLLRCEVDLDGHRPYCKTNLNAVNKSCFYYMEMSRGYLMPYTHVRVPGTKLTEVAPSADHTAVCFADGPKDPCSRLLKDSRNYGIVYAAGLMGPAELFYCPDQPKAPYRLQDYPRPWGSAVPQGTKLIFCGYMFNPWVKAATAEGKRLVHDDGLVPSRHPIERFLTADLITGPETIAHTSKKAPHWNAGFTDGHVEQLESKPLAEMFAKQPQTDWSSWEHWGAASADGKEPGPGTIRYELVNMPKP